MAQSLVEAGVKANRVQRHLDVHGSGELGAHATHTLSCGALTLMRLALDHEHVVASCLGEVVSDA